MKKTKALPKLNQVQKTCETVLKWGIPGIAFFHVGLILAGYFLGDSFGNTMLNAEKWVFIGFFGFAVLYCVYTMFALPGQMVRIKLFLKGLFRPETVLLSALYIWNIFCVFSADKTYKANFWQLNDTALFELFACFFVLFIFAYVLTKNAEKALDILFMVVAAVMTGLMIWVLWTVCKPSVIFLPGGGQIGMTSEARLSINCHPNTVGAYAEVILMMCLYLAVKRKCIIRILSLLALPVHYVTIILSDSRTCMITTAFTVGAVIAKLVFDATKEKDTWKRILFSFLAFGACFAVLMALRQPVRIGYESISHFTLLATGGSGHGGITETAVNTGRTMEITTNGRTDIWAAAINSAFSDSRHIFFGVTPVGVVSEINKWMGANYNFYTHNQFLEVLVSNGIPGLLLYTAWLVLIAKKCIKTIVLRNSKTQKGLVVIGGMIMMLVIANLLEATLLYYRYFTAGLFFLLCGIITFREKDEPEQLNQHPSKKH